MIYFSSNKSETLSNILLCPISRSQIKKLIVCYFDKVLPIQKKKGNHNFWTKSCKNGHCVRGTEHISFRIVAKGAHEQLPLGAKSNLEFRVFDCMLIKVVLLKSIIFKTVFQCFCSKNLYSTEALLEGAAGALASRNLGIQKREQKEGETIYN